MLLKRPSFFIGILMAVFLASFFAVRGGYSQTPSVSLDEEGFDAADEIMTPEPYVHPRLRGLDTWQRPAGPFRVALQAGHWQASEAPDEQENLRKNGTSAAGVTEWETNLEIAETTKKLLEPYGIIVDILPTTIPPNYWADVFVAIHADGNANTAVSGYKAAAPRRDVTGKAQTFASLLEASYERATGLDHDPNITRNMRGYYAFNWRRYEHSLHPMTVAVILETGFLTNAGDRRIIVEQPQKSAAGIAEAIVTFLGVPAQ